jgi:thioredoxin 1
MHPILDSLAEEFAGKATIGRINVDDEPKLSSEYSINAIPTVILFYKGQVAEQWRGIDPDTEEHLTNALNKVLAE